MNEAKQYFKNEHISLDGWHSQNGDKHIVKLQLTDLGYSPDPNAFNFICQTKCNCEMCAWRHADKKAAAFLKAIGVKK